MQQHGTTIMLLYTIIKIILIRIKVKCGLIKSLSMRGGKFPFWVYAYKAQIYNRYGDKKEALKAAEKSLEMAKKTGNHHSIGMSTRALKEVQESP